MTGTKYFMTHLAVSVCFNAMVHEDAVVMLEVVIMHEPNIKTLRHS